MVRKYVVSNDEFKTITKTNFCENAHKKMNFTKPFLMVLGNVEFIPSM